MPTTTLPLTAFNQHFLFDADVILETSTKVSFSSFFYIGDRHATVQYFAPYFKKGIFAEDFDKAMSKIFSITQTNNKVPDVILIDTPIDQAKFEAFSFLIKNTVQLSEIPVIYNDRHLTTEMVYNFVSNDLIDEATNINSWDILFVKKLKFLSKVKSRSRKAVLKSSSKHSNSYNKLKINSILKRSFDIAVSTVLLILLLPLFILIAVLIRFESKGPVFYIAPRAGRGFKIFRFFKFRTMEVGADTKIHELAHMNQYCTENAKGTFLKICDDPRVTKVGQFLRNSSLDELPQLINVLIGDMSLVGNRPLPIYEAATLTHNDAVERFMAPAGITGLWQVEKRSNEKMSAEERINLDIIYARRHSFVYDMGILVRTPMAMFQKTNV